MAGGDRAFIERSIRVGITTLVVVGTSLALLWLLKAALTPLITAFVIAYLFDPLIDRFEAQRVKRSAAIAIVIAAMGGGLMGFLFFVVPRLIAELAVLGQELPLYLEQVLENLIPRFEARTGIEVPGTVAEVIERIRTGELKLPLQSLRGVLEGVTAALTGTIMGIIGLLVVPVLAYYLLVEFDAIKPKILSLVPPRHRDYVTQKAHTVDGLVSGFLRGQLTIAFILGILYAVGFSVIGIDAAVGVGLLAGVMALVPYLGNVVAVTAASGLCILKFGIDIHLVLVLGWYVVVQNLEGFVLTPRIIGHSVGLHPAVVIVALLIGADLLGFLGMLIAVPSAAVVKVFLEEAIEAYRRSDLFDDTPEASGG